MTARETIVKTIITVFAVSETKWDDHNYPYDDIKSSWEKPEQALDAVEALFGKPEGKKIFRRSLDLTSTGRLTWHGLGVVWEDGLWTDLKYDPRYKDPQFKEYLRLKEIYG